MILVNHGPNKKPPGYRVRRWLNVPSINHIGGKLILLYIAMVSLYPKLFSSDKIKVFLTLVKYEYDRELKKYDFYERLCCFCPVFL